MTSLYSFTAKALNGEKSGEEIKFSEYEGQVLLIVNTASQCGFTPQYAGLQKLEEKFGARGFKVLGFPCNQFGKQEPGDAKEITTFCEKNYGVTFQLFEKINVNGENAHPVFQWLTESAPGILGIEAIKWNFTKFLINRQGEIVKRYAPLTKPESLEADIEANL